MARTSRGTMGVKGALKGGLLLGASYTGQRASSWSLAYSLQLKTSEASKAGGQAGKAWRAHRQDAAAALFGRAQSG